MNYFDTITWQRVSHDQMWREYKANKDSYNEELGVTNFYDFMKVAGSEHGFIRVIN